MKVKRKIPDIELERLALGELTADRESEVRRSLEAEQGGMGRLAQINASTEEILERYPPHLMAVAIKDRASESKTRWRTWYAVPVLTAAAAAMLIFIFVPVSNPRYQTPTYEEIRIKGDDEPTLFVYRKRVGGDELLGEGSQVTAGDVLQLKYTARKALHGVICSIDGRGTVTLHFPANPDGSTVLESGGAQVLDFSYELDDAPGFERFFFITSSNPIDVRTILQAGRKHGQRNKGDLDLPSTFLQTDFLLRKK
jgi:hypothetical protein